MLKINLKILFLFIFSVLISLSSFAKDPAPEPVTWNQDLKELVFGDDIIKDGSALFSLDTPYRALDAAIARLQLGASPREEAFKSVGLSKERMDKLFRAQAASELECF